MSESIKDNIKYSPEIFNGHQDIYLIYRRIENLSAAIFLVTDSIPESGVILGQNLKQKAIDTLSSIISVINATQDYKYQNHVQKLASNILELHSLLNISFWSGAITEMNASLLQRELLKIHDSLSDLISQSKQKILIDQSLFSAVDLEDRHYKNMSYKTNKGQDIKDRYVQKSPLQSNSPNTQIVQNTDSQTKTDRRQSILNLLKQKDNLSIKDFATIISGYSEKTIQRELLALVEEGAIKKIGERRWSTYSLNK